ncbi:alpha-ketoglutarate-dependent dioxygenase alkB 6 [Cryptosporidium sp. chipmunk genotype I]|uniref:alpha-ketoglutarate-dependent dioxygenase alkB 6 n=1 Tax=Cryptosporidium sp. chipmunk genotype I TaxID=1280935 RepID=UPI00351A80BC|nr:alpha-ketoglutarate-dependent dioxygenase alkB 6 [Cryptosporidium sp. chipmunk genotype I]
MIKDFIRKIKDSGKENLAQNSEKSVSIVCSKPVEYIKLGTIKPSLCREIEPIPSQFPTVYCIQNWITSEQEKTLLENISRSSFLNVKLKGRQTQVWGGTVSESGIANQKDLPEWLKSISQSLVDFNIFSKETTPNHVLINQYEQCKGILPHKDGPLYYPKVAIISLESDTLFDFWSPSLDIQENKFPLFSLIVPKLSLLVFQDLCYTQLLHGISSRYQDDLENHNVINIKDFPHLSPNSTIKRGFRTSLTFRFVKTNN